MNVLKKAVILVGCVVALGLGASTLMAGGGFGGGGGGRGGGRGGGGGFNLDQARQAMGVTDDAAWNAIVSKIAAVQTAQRANQAPRGGGRNRNGGGRGATANPTPLTEAVAALQKAYDDNAPVTEIKAAIKKVEDVRKANEDALVKAQDDLRSLLTSRQEAYLTLNGGILR